MKEEIPMKGTWPKAPILLLGTFGSSDPAGRRYHRSCWIALLGMVAWVLVWICLSRFDHTLARTMRLATPLPLTLLIGYIALSFRRYLLSLDELAQRIQLESIAWTYLTMLVVGVALGALAFSLKWNPNLLWLVIVAEPIRACWLYFGAQRY